MIRIPTPSSSSPRSSRSGGLSGAVAISSHARRSGAPTSTGRSSDDAAAVITAPAAAKITTAVFRSPMNASQVASIASRLWPGSTRLSRITFATRRPTSPTTPAIIAPMPKTTMSRRRSALAQSAAAAARTAIASRIHGSALTPSATVAAVAMIPGSLSVSTSTSAPPGICFASFGANACSAPRAVVPMSARVRVTVFASFTNRLRCRSRAAAANRSSNGLLRTAPAITCSITGCTEIRSGFALTSCSETRLPISLLTASLESAAEARSANWSELRIVCAR